MNKKQFIELIENHLKWFDELDKVDKIFNSFILETDWGGYADKLFNIILEQNFTQEEIDDINWWMYEKLGNPDIKMWCEGEEVPMDTIEDLWNWIKLNRQ